MKYSDERTWYAMCKPSSELKEVIFFVSIKDVSDLQVSYVPRTSHIRSVCLFSLYSSFYHIMHTALDMRMKSNSLDVNLSLCLQMSTDIHSVLCELQPSADATVSLTMGQRYMASFLDQATSPYLERSIIMVRLHVLTPSRPFYDVGDKGTVLSYSVMSRVFSV